MIQVENTPVFIQDADVQPLDVHRAEVVSGSVKLIAKTCITAGFVACCVIHSVRNVKSGNDVFIHGGSRESANQGSARVFLTVIDGDERVAWTGRHANAFTYNGGAMAS